MRLWPLSTGRPRLWTLDHSFQNSSVSAYCVFSPVHIGTVWRQQTPEFAVIRMLVTEQNVPGVSTGSPSMAVLPPG